MVCRSCCDVIDVVAAIERSKVTIDSFCITGYGLRITSYSNVVYHSVRKSRVAVCIACTVLRYVVCMPLHASTCLCTGAEGQGIK